MYVDAYQICMCTMSKAAVVLKASSADFWDLQTNVYYRSTTFIICRSVWASSMLVWQSAAFCSSMKHIAVFQFSGVAGNTSVTIAPEDYEGPLHSMPTQDTDYLLILAWAFTVLVVSTMFLQSNRGQAVWNFLVSFGVDHHHHQHIDWANSVVVVARNGCGSCAMNEAKNFSCDIRKKS